MSDKRPIYAKGYKYYVPKPTTLSGWKYYCLLAGLTGFLGLALYPIVVDPVINEDKYKRIHKEVQTELFQSGLLPGQLKKWEDPWKKMDK